MINSVRFNIFLFLLTTLLCLGGLGLVFSLRDDRILQSYQAMDETRETIVQTQGTVIQIYGLLSLQRGYLLSGEETLLTEYDQGKARLTEGLARLRERFHSNPAQESRGTELQHHSFALMENLDKAIQAYKAGQMKDGPDDIYQIMGLRRSIDRVTGAILSEEYDMLQLYRGKMAKARQALYIHLGIGVFLASIILTFLYSYLLIAHDRRMSAEESLKIAEERLRLAVRGTNDGIYDWNLQTQALYWSPPFKSMLGYEEAEIKASLETLDALMHPADRDHVKDVIHKYLHRELSDLSCVFRLRHKDGRWLWINMRGRALFDEDGRAVRLSGAYSDISPLKEYETRLEEARDQAEKANAAKTEFLAHMSHEIRTPLTSISGVAEILMNQRKDMSQKQQQLVNVLSYSTTNLKELINDILDFSKIESGQLELENKPFSLAELFQEIISVVTVRAQEKGLDFSFDYADVASVTYIGDKTRLNQILMNLIGNAMKFTKAGLVDVRVSRKLQDGQPVMQIDVRDTGIGIDKKNFALIFERFRQADASVSRKYGGTGLGLPISKSLVESMGGRITLESELERGSVFTVTLPLTAAGGVDGHHPARASSLSVANFRVGQGLRVLLVEDYEGNVAVLSYILEAIGCEFSIARTGLEALNLWKEGHHDLILMDVQMPEMDGLTATRQIRKMEEEDGLHRTPIIGMTAHAFIEDKDKCSEAGMDSFLAKPISEVDLVREISRALEAKEARRNGQASVSSG